MTDRAPPRSSKTTPQGGKITPIVRLPSLPVPVMRPPVLRTVLLLVALAGCGSDRPDRDLPTVDASLTDASTADAAPPAFDHCDGPCAVTSARATFGATEEPFDVAYFGLDADGRIRVELYGEAAPGCPTMTSPTPARTLVIHGLRPQTEPAEQTDGLAVTLFDFDGSLTSEPLLRATSASVHTEAARLTPTADAFVAIDITAAFPDGTVTGHAYATHCESLSAP